MSSTARKRDESDSPGLLPPEALDGVALRFRVLSSASRLRILNALTAGPRSMGELVEMTGLEQSNLSRHVAALEQGGCVARHREGQRVLVDVVDPSLKPLCEVVCASLAAD